MFISSPTPQRASETYMDNHDSANNLLILLASFVAGAAFLCLLSTIQKITIGAPLCAKGYIVPLAFGGISGAIIGRQFYKVVQLNARLTDHVTKLERIIPICSNCKRIRKPDSDPTKMASWEQLEFYLSKRTSSRFSHGICPDCMKELYGDVDDENDENVDGPFPSIGPL